MGMWTVASSWYELAADTVLVFHFLFVAFVVLALPLILVGGARGWRWVRNVTFRVVHVCAMGVVVVESVFGWVCPLTDWEMALRRAAGQPLVDDYSFIAYWVDRILFYQGPPAVFTGLYIAFFVAIIASWVFFPPQRAVRAADSPASAS